MLQNHRRRIQGITIDPPCPQDLDDAFWLEPSQHGHILHVSIADVANYVYPGSGIDRKAAEQCFTIYSPRTRHMLTQHLVDCLSLEQGMKRDSVTITIPLNTSLEPGTPVIERTYLFNRKKFTFQEAEQAMHNSNPHSGMLRQARDIAHGLLDKKKKRGAIVNFNLKDRIFTTEEGEQRRLRDAEAFNSFLIISEFMTLTNQVLAQFFSEQNIPCIYRNHTARAKPGLDPTSAGAGFNNNGRAFMIPKKADYGATPLGHWGLNLPVYVHFTSPIRRYPDLLNAMQLLAFLEGRESPHALEDLEEKAAGINRQHHYSRMLEKLANRRIDREKREEALYADISSITDKQLHSILLDAVHSGFLRNRLGQEVLKRLKAGELTEREFYTILFESPREKGWHVLQQEAMHYVSQHPGHASAILYLAAQNKKTTIPGYRQARDNGRAYATGEIKAGGITYASDPQYFPIDNKVHPRHRVNLNLLSKIVNA